MREIKPVGICPRCLLVPRLPGRAYCAECGKAVTRKNQVRPRRRHQHIDGKIPVHRDTDEPVAKS